MRAGFVDVADFLVAGFLAATFFAATGRRDVFAIERRAEGRAFGRFLFFVAISPHLCEWKREGIMAAIMNHPPSADADSLALLERFAEAWNRHDLDALMSMMTDDCVFEASAGPEVSGQRHEGQQAVRAAYAAVYEAFPDAHWGHARHFIAGNRGVSEWTFTGTRSDGRHVAVTGCDLFTLRDGRIAIKNSYRKNRPPQD